MPSLMIVRESFLMWLWAHFFSGMAFFCAVKESASFWLFFLFQVVLSAGVLSLVFVGGVQMCHSARTSSQPHRLVPLANGMSQLALTLTLLMIAVILPMLAQLRYQSLFYKSKVPWSPFCNAIIFYENYPKLPESRNLVKMVMVALLCFMDTVHSVVSTNPSTQVFLEMPHRYISRANFSSF